MGLCSDFERDRQSRIANQTEARREYRERTRKPPEPRHWRLLVTISKAHYRHEKTLRDQLMLQLAMETKATWYLEKVGALA